MCSANVSVASVVGIVFGVIFGVAFILVIGIMVFKRIKGNFLYLLLMPYTIVFINIFLDGDDDNDDYDDGDDGANDVMIGDQYDDPYSR